MMNAQGVFVTGTDTGVGKTLVSAILTLAWNATYWKPMQTGTLGGDDDTRDVAALAGLGTDRVLRPLVALPEPASPERAAELEGVRVQLADVTPPTVAGPLVVEGAGGLLVPLNERETIADLAALLGLPLVVVARSGLGTINHTLLTLEAARARSLDVRGVILSGPPAPHNRRDIERHGNVRVLLEVPPITVDPAEVRRIAAKVPPLREVLA